MFLPSHLRPRPGTASAVDRLSIGRLVGEQCNFDQSSIVARMSSRAMQNGRSWVKKRNLGQKKRNPGRKNRVSGTFSERFYREGGRKPEKFSRAGKQFFCATQVIFRKVSCYYRNPSRLSILVLGNFLGGRTEMLTFELS